MPINNGGGGNGSIVYEVDPTAVKLVGGLPGGLMSGTLYVPKVQNLLNENLVLDAYNDTGAGTHNLFKFNPFGGALEFPIETDVPGEYYNPVSIERRVGGTTIPRIQLEGIHTASETFKSLILTPGEITGYGQPKDDDSDVGSFNLTHNGISGSSSETSVDWGHSASQVYGEQFSGDNSYVLGWNGLQIATDTGVSIVEIVDTFHNKVTDADYKQYRIYANATDGLVLRHEKNIAPNATTFNEISVSATNGVKVNGVGLVREDTTVYAKLNGGASFTGGKVFANAGTTTAPLNLSTGVIPASSVAGDIWISGSSIKYKDAGGTERIVADTNRGNTYTSSNTFQSSTSSPTVTINQTGSGAGLKITNTGTGDTVRIEDETSPDATPFVINASGRVGIGIEPSTVALTLDNTGIKINGTTLIPGTTVTTVSSFGINRELQITINGVSYAIPLRVV